MLVEGIFPLGLIRVLTPSPPPPLKKKKKKKKKNESIDWGLVCAHMHSIARAQKILTLMSWTGECRQQKSHLACTIYEEGMWLYRNGWTKNRSHTIQKKVNPRDIAGNAEEKTCVGHLSWPDILSLLNFYYDLQQKRSLLFLLLLMLLVSSCWWW